MSRMIRVKASDFWGDNLPKTWRCSKNSRFHLECDWGMHTGFLIAKVRANPRSKHFKRLLSLNFRGGVHHRSEGETLRDFFRSFKTRLWVLQNDQERQALLKVLEPLRKWVK